MTHELKKRITTSTFLFVIAIFCIFFHRTIFSISVLLILFISYREWSKMNYKYFYKKKSSINDPYIIVKILGFSYLILVFYSALFLRDQNKFYFMIILLICIFSDIGGYVFGKIIGGKKLTRISPNKTVSGSAGSFAFSLIPLILFSFQNYVLIDLNFSLKNILFCLVISLSCQIGDLIISFFKRLNKVKNTGNILPGHGGLLDRIDGIIFVLPTIYILKIIDIF